MSETSTPVEEQPAIHHFVCLPYLNLQRTPEIDFGFAKIWNFDLCKEKYIPDTPLRKQVERILKTYRAPYPYPHRNGENIHLPVSGIGMLSLGVDSTLPHDSEQRQSIKDARLILFVSFVAANNTITRNVNSGHSMASSENFAPIFFSTVVGSPYITDQGGFVVPAWHGGIEIDKNMQLRPWHVRTPSLRIDTELFKALLKLRGKRKRASRRFISAVDVFYESFYNAAEVSHSARILLQASAFEILLDAPAGQGRQALKQYLKQEATYPETRKVTFRSERGNRVVIETSTIHEKWADRFFSLRNHIIHGHVPKEKEYYFGKWQRHFDIATYFFVLCLKRKIEEELGEYIFGDDVDWKSWTDDLELPSKTYSGFEYAFYGRRGWQRIVQKIKKT